MTLVREITALIERIAPLAYQESYDNAGLIVGSPNDEVSGVLIALDATEEVVDEAIALGYNMVVVHHPIVFSGLKKLNGKNYVERAVIKAIKNSVAIYAAHTNLDNRLHNGVNAKICQILGVKSPKILAPKSGIIKKLVTYVPLDNADALRQALFDAGAGSIGNYDECSFSSLGVGTFRPGNGTTPYIGAEGKRSQVPEMKIEVVFEQHLQGAVLSALMGTHPYEEVAYEVFGIDNEHAQIGAGMVGNLAAPINSMDFLKFLKKVMGAGVVKHTAITSETIHRVAVCGGAGSFLLRQAIAARADIFITADYKYHEFFDAEGKIIIADIGHYESEQFTSEIFYDIIKEKYPNFAARITTVRTNPVSYL